MIDDLINICRDKGLKLPLKNVRHCMISSNSNDSGNDLIFLFLADKKLPDYLIKIGRSKENNKGIINEYNCIQYILCNKRGNSLTPDVIHYGEYNGKAYFVQNVITGKGLSESLIRGINPRTNACIEQSIDFIADLFKLGPLIEISTTKAAENALLAELKSFVTKPMYHNRIETAIEKLGIIKCLAHGDFWVTNIITDKAIHKIIGIIDYEFGDISCYTYFDIFWFLANLAMFLESANSFIDSYKTVFFSYSPNTSYYQKVLYKYFSQIDQPIPDIADLVIISLLYASFREKRVFGKSLHMDQLCREILLWTIENESLLKFPTGA